jgi:hypothetical protein
LSETLANPHRDPRRNIACRLIAYDDRRDVSVFLTDHDRVFVHDGHTMNTRTLTEPKEELRDWLPPVNTHWRWTRSADTRSRPSLNPCCVGSSLSCGYASVGIDGAATSTYGRRDANPGTGRTRRIARRAGDRK